MRAVNLTKLALFGGSEPETFSRLIRHAVHTSVLFFASQDLHGCVDRDMMVCFTEQRLVICIKGAVPDGLLYGAAPSDLH